MVRISLLMLAPTALLAQPALASVGGETAFMRDSNGAVVFKNYPARALAAGEQGKVGFRVTLDKDGNLTSCDVTESSGYARLDRETCELIAGHAVFAPVKDAEGRSTLATHLGYVNWQLPEGATARPAAATRTASAAPEKMICRRSVRTGSLVGTSKICMTKSDWERTTNRAQENWGQMQGRGASWDSPTGP